MSNPHSHSTQGLYGLLLLLRYIRPKLSPSLAPDSAVSFDIPSFPGEGNAREIVKVINIEIHLIDADPFRQVQSIITAYLSHWEGTRRHFLPFF